MGFHVFPLKENTKFPHVTAFTEAATNDPEDLAKFWFDPVLGFEHQYNIGIATTHFKDGGLLVVDIDNKDDKKGNTTVLKLELEGFELPKTLTQRTPTGGFHYIFRVKEPVKQGAGLYGEYSGFDTRSRGGLILGAGSEINGKKYTFVDETIAIAEAPEWLIKKCNEGVTSERKAKTENIKVPQKNAMIRGEEYLLNHAELAIQGAGGDQTTFIVASRLKDLGVNADNCFTLMFEHWNERCQPPWNPDELQSKVENAYAYGQNKAGVDSPESDFEVIDSAGEDEDEDEIGDPVEELNKQYSFLVLGGKSTIIRHCESNRVDYIGVQAFHDLLRSRTVQLGDGKRKRLSIIWFESYRRNTYHRTELLPGKKSPPGVFNLWRGFSCEPLSADETPTAEMIEGVRLFKEHALENVCGNDTKLFNWLMGYFAHLVQRPWEKPLTALVFKGKKGVGKNALIDRIGNLISHHYLLTSNRRYVTSNFNKHLATLLLFVLDEAFWSGDKQAEGILKDLITGHTHLIEHKGHEMFSTGNMIRLVIIGNEDWVVPASEDERRFAVFKIGVNRIRDKPYFRKMKYLLESRGGNRLLLKELMDFDIDSVDVDEAPETEGLLDQKIESLSAIHSWWYSSLKEGAVLNLEFSGEEWPKQVGRQAMREAFLDYSKARGVRSWLPDSSVFGRQFAKCCPGAKDQRGGTRTNRLRNYALPTLLECRRQFELFIGQKIKWDDVQVENVIDAKSLFS